MTTYTQERQNLKVESVLGADVLLARRLVVSERMSAPFELELEVFSEDDGVDESSLLRSPMTVAVSESRFFHGFVRSFSQLGRHDDLTAYRAVLVPQLWFLSLSRESRVFHEVTVPDVLRQVLDEQGLSDVSFQLTGTYESREYRIQYRESHLDFISRLMEDEGIFYFFDHTDSGCELVIADHPSAHKDVEPSWAAELPMGFSATPDERRFSIHSIVRDHRVHVGTVTLRDVNTERSMDPMDSSERSEGEEQEDYDFPGGFLARAEGDRRARVRVEEEEAGAVVISGRAGVPPLQPGRTFELTGHFRSSTNGKYLVLGVTHRARAAAYRAGENDDGDYENEFTAIPADVPFRPARRTPLPRIPGMQTALVVAGDANTVHTDGDGRVKVQFFWDREGDGTESKSCWVPVATLWAGATRGMLGLPRVNDEVVVEFLEGDPDRPIVTGAVYNRAHNHSPWDLPGEATRMGIRSLTWGQGRGFNEVSLDDRDGEELVYLHAQRDMETKVLNDQRNLVEKNVTENVGVNRTRSVKGNESVEVVGDRSVKVDGDHSTEIGGKEDRTVGGDQSLDVGGKQGVDVTGEISQSSGQNMTLSAGQAFELSIAQGGEISANTTIAVKAGVSITLEAGGSKVEIGPAGVKISGVMVQIEGAGMVEVKGGMVKVN